MTVLTASERPASERPASERPALEHPAPEGSLEATRDAGEVRWLRICHVDLLDNAWGEAALIDGRQVAVFRVSDSEVYAVDQRDPATGANVMSRGIVGSKGVQPTISSPLHKEVYLLATGECLTDPALLLATYPVRLEEGDVMVRIDAGLKAGLDAVAEVGAAA